MKKIVCIMLSLIMTIGVFSFSANALDENTNEGFKEGDVIYLDLSEFSDWTVSSAIIYANFTELGKENGSISIGSADPTKYAPREVTETDGEYYKYTVTQSDAGATAMRFWRGSSTSLWNCSVVLNYSDYASGNTCVKVTGWNESGSITRITNTFTAGDTIYLRLHEDSWLSDNTKLYANFSAATKEENGNNDITIDETDSKYYSPKEITNKINDTTFSYILTEEDATKSTMRFWVGTDKVLTDYSVAVTYQNLNLGNNCVTVSGKEATGIVSKYYEINIEEPTSKYGDANDDGTVDIKDVTDIQQNIAEFDITIDEKYADVNNDDEVNIQDASTIQRYLAGIITKFPASQNDDTDWRTSSIGYEIFVRSFCDSDGNGCGDFRGIAQKVDYLKSLNVGVVWLMPMMKTSSYHGYDIVDYYSVNEEYGTLEDFNYMLDVLHKNDIRVIIDFVANHTASACSWFKSASSSKTSPYRDYYLWNTTGGSNWYKSSTTNSYYYGYFTSSMPDLNFNNKTVWAQIEDSAGYWLSQGIDGFRLDAAMHVGDGDDDLTHSWWQDFEKYVKSINPNAYVVGENWSSTGVIAPFYADMDSSFNFPLMSDIQSFAKSNLTSSIISTVNSAQNKYTTYANSTPNVPKKTIDSIMLGNHDTDRVASLFSGNKNYLKMAAAVELTLPGMTWIYYGDELGQTGSGSDPNKREPMDWYKSATGTDMTKMTWGTNNNTKANDGISVEEQSGTADSLLEYYRTLSTIRTEHPIFYQGTYRNIANTSGTTSYTITDDNYNYSMYVLHNNKTSNVTFTAQSDFTDLVSGVSYQKGDKIIVKSYTSMIVKYDDIVPVAYV